MSRARGPGWSAADEARLAETVGAAVVPVAPSAAAKARLLAAVANPWVRALAAFAALVDLPAERAERVLDRAERGLDWGPGPLPGVGLVHFAGGPATAGCDVGLVRLPPDQAFPPHRHLGRESVVVLDGDYVDSAGYTMKVGDGETREPGSPHSFRAGPNGVVLAVVLREGIEVPDPAGGPPIVLRG